MKVKLMDGTSISGVWFSGEFEALLHWWQMGADPEMTLFFASDRVPPAGRNINYYRDAELTKILYASDRTVDQAKRRDLLIQGSSTLYGPLLAAGLIDRLVLMIFPVVLGTGKSIFDGPHAAEALKLVSHSISDKGVIFLEYESGGEVPTGSFATKEPSPDELELQGKIKEGNW